MISLAITCKNCGSKVSVDLEYGDSIKLPSCGECGCERMTLDGWMFKCILDKLYPLPKPVVKELTLAEGVGKVKAGTLMSMRPDGTVEPLLVDLESQGVHTSEMSDKIQAALKGKK